MAHVSIVIPSHNRWYLLRRTLAGALAQERVDCEVIVVDDGSSDGTSERLAELDEASLRVLRHERGRGVAHARNRGLEAASGEWVAFLDDDDLWAPLKLRCQLDAAIERDAPFAYGGAIVVDERLDVLDVQRAPPPERLLDDVLGWQAVPGGCSNAIVKTELAREVNGFNPELSMAADWDMWTRPLLGERAMRRFSPYRPERLPKPEWLALYGEGGRLESVPVTPTPRGDAQDGLQERRS